MEPNDHAAFVFTDDGEVFAIPSIVQQGWLEYVEVNEGAYPAIYTADGWVVEATSEKWDVTLTLTGVRDEKRSTSAAGCR
jgi:hypothetical protein